MSTSIPQRICERALSRAVNSATGCRISTYSVGSHGYAQLGWSENGRIQMVLGHRAAWTGRNGPIPDGFTIDHTCKVRRCVNTDHMRLLSNFENARRTHGRDWQLGTCPSGHGPEHLVAITRRTKNGRRRTGYTCGVCVDESRRRYLQRKAEEKPFLGGVA